jgi:hypothetical protein
MKRDDGTIKQEGSRSESKFHGLQEFTEGRLLNLPPSGRL